MLRRGLVSWILTGFIATGVASAADDTSRASGAAALARLKALAGEWRGHVVTPDGPPVIGATRYSNLHLNTGHGTLGWTMACGSARVLADVMSGHAPEIRADDLSVERYAQSKLRQSTSPLAEPSLRT